jgi:hypothetical protein
MPELVESHGGDVASAFPRSRALLDRAVSLPATVLMAEDRPAVVRDALVEVLAGVDGSNK